MAKDAEKRSHLDLDPKLFPQFPLEASSGRFAGTALPSREFPQPAKQPALRPTADQDAAVPADDARRGDPLRRR